VPRAIRSSLDERLPETLHAVEHELTALLRRGRALFWEIARADKYRLRQGIIDKCIASYLG